MSAEPIDALAKVLERIRNAWIEDRQSLTFLESLDKNLTTIQEMLRKEKEMEHTLPSGYGEDVSDVVDSMFRFASRHWMHDEGQNTREFANRIKRAYLKEKEYYEGCIASLKKELEEARNGKCRQ